MKLGLNELSRFSKYQFDSCYPETSGLMMPKIYDIEFLSLRHVLKNSSRTREVAAAPFSSRRILDIEARFLNVKLIFQGQTSKFGDSFPLCG